MITVTPAAQLSVVDSSTNPSTTFPIVPGGAAILCPSGALLQDATLAVSTSNAALAFPIGVSTAAFFFIVAVSATDLIVKVGTGSPVSLTVPQGQALMLYNIASNAITVSSALGGTIQYAVGG